jgi:hypothetical protein
MTIHEFRCELSCLSRMIMSFGEPAKPASSEAIEESRFDKGAD